MRNALLVLLGVFSFWGLGTEYKSPIILYFDADSNLTFSTDLKKETKLLGAFAKMSGPSWLTVNAEGRATGIPRKSHEGLNRFQVECRELGGVTDIDLNVTVHCSS